MRWSKSTRIFSATMPLLLCASLLNFVAGDASAQRRSVQSPRRTTGRAAGTARPIRQTKPALGRAVPATMPLPAIAPLPATVNPFQSLKTAAGTTGIIDITFTPTNLDPRARATGQIALVGRTLLVRVKAEDVPLPNTYGVPRYAMWVYVPNHGVRIYIGDLPITPTTGTRGKSDSAYRYTALPANAVFGGLMLTAEPVRYEPVVNEPLRPLLTSLADGVNPKYANTALTVYSYPLVTPVRNRAVRRSPATPPKRNNRRANTPPRGTRKN